MSKDAGFVPLQSYLDRGNAQQESAEPQTSAKSGSAWGGKKEQKTLSIAELQELETKKKAEEDKKKQEERKQAPSGTYKPTRRTEEPSYTGISADRYAAPSYGGNQYGDDQFRGGARREYAPREKNPVPVDPPYTAYIGNLPFDRASEEMLGDFFGELGVEVIRVIRDPATQQPKGFAYIQFKDRAGLESALQADGSSWGSRNITVDVATTKNREEDRGRWGPRDGGNSGASGYQRSGNFDGRSNGQGFGERGNTGGFGGERDRFEQGRFDASGGSWRNQKPVAASASTSSGGPPKIDLQPRTKPVEEIGTTAKRAGEDPFGGASIDADKLKKQAEERLKRDQERDRKNQEQVQKIQREREEKARSFGAAAAGTGKTDSWRGNNDDNKGSSGGRGGGRGGSRGGRGGRFENSWGNDKPEKKAPQPSKAEAERADALINPYDVLNNEDDNKQ